ncbi:MAG: efflux RND transporter periplasmic adaptor subunit, partial [Pirellulales bacterium]
MATYDDDHNRNFAPDEPIDEGGLRAPPGLTGWRKAWWWFDFIILVKLARLRFIAVLLVIGVVITQWDTLLAYYDRWTRPSDYETVAGGDFEFFCPMHPTVVRPTNKEKCPICFMPLSKRKKGEQQDVVLPAGTVSRVQLSPYRVVLAGIQTFPVEFVPLKKAITAVGYVDFNERLQRSVAARVDGRIDDLYANETGRFVKAGDDLALFYSPELNVTMQNLRDAQQAGQADLMASARNRLKLFGIEDDQIDEALAAGKSEIHLRIRSPISGHIIRKYVQEGQYVSEGTPLYDLAGLSTVWIQAQVYEDDMAALPLENIHQQDNASTTDVAVTAETPAFPGKTFRGKLSFIYPHVDQATRSVTVRCEIENTGAEQLMPG